MLGELYKSYYGTSPESLLPLTGSASNRRYYRLESESGRCIGVEGTDSLENKAFVTLARHFRAKGLNVPEVYALSEDGGYYIQEDLGDDILYDRLVRARRSSEGMDEMEELLRQTVRLLPKIQFEGAKGLDFSLCYPQPSFDRRMVMFASE